MTSNWEIKRVTLNHLFPFFKGKTSFKTPEAKATTCCWPDKEAVASAWAIVLKRSQSSIGALGVLEMDEFFFLKIRTVSYWEVYFFVEVLFFFATFLEWKWVGLKWVEFNSIDWLLAWLMDEPIRITHSKISRRVGCRVVGLLKIATFLQITGEHPTQEATATFYG